MGDDYGRKEIFGLRAPQRVRPAYSQRRMMGAYTFTLRGGVFCNAQTANVVLMAIAFGQGRWEREPITSSRFRLTWPGPSYRRSCPRRCGVWASSGGIPTWWPLNAWRCLRLGSSFILAPSLGAGAGEFHRLHAVQHLPPGGGHPYGHHLLHQPAAAGGHWFCQGGAQRRPGGLRRALFFLGMLGCFFLGGAASAFAGTLLSAKAIWLNLIPLGVVLVRLVHADLTDEKDQLSRKPRAIEDDTTQKRRRAAVPTSFFVAGSLKGRGFCRSL